MNIIKNYEIAKEIYAEIGVDCDIALEKLSRFVFSVQCWQGDDVGGFEKSENNSDINNGGGIMSTGNYIGKARSAKELQADMKFAFDLIPGKSINKKANIHASYLDNANKNNDKKVERNEIMPEDYSGWVNWAKELKIGLDFNPTFFAHKFANSGSTLASADENIRKFWIEHGKRSRKVAEYFGKETGIRAINNIWIPDGFKDCVIDKLAPRERLISSLDEILREMLDPSCMSDALESKLFGIGSESYVVGSHEFYLLYVMKNKQNLLTLDSGHFHPTEFISGKISAIMPFIMEMLLHVSRPVRWDSDHVVALDGELIEICREALRSEYNGRINFALDYFDGSINRIAAWIIGSRNLLKAVLYASLEPFELLKNAELEGDLTKRLAISEELKSMPFGAVWDYYCEKNNVAIRGKWLDEVKLYEKNVLAKRD